MRYYELTYIVKPDVDATNLAGLIERVNGFITNEGGVVVKTDQWGLRRLSYPIRKFRDGHYVFSIVELEAPALARIEQRLRLVEDILRYLLVRADDEGVLTDAAAAEAAEAAEASDIMGGADLGEASFVEATDAVTDALVATPEPSHAAEDARTAPEVEEASPATA